MLSQAIETTGLAYSREDDIADISYGRCQRA